MNRTGFHIIAEKGASYCMASGLKTVPRMANTLFRGVFTSVGREGVLSGFWVENGAHHFRDTQSELDYELVKTNSVIMGAPLDGAHVDVLLLHLLRRLHFRGKMKVFSGLRMKKNCSCH